LSDFAVFCANCVQVHEPDLSKLLNQTVGGRYKIYRQLGQGGLSTVFAATDLQTDSVVVVKVSDPAQLVRRELTYSIDAEAAQKYWREMLERMRHEAEALTGIEHPNIVRLFDSGMIGDDLRFVAMEFLRGRTLREELDARGKLDIAEAVAIALQLCEALGEVHARGIVHRDVNPRNVMLGNCAKLIDFGIAKFPQPPGAPPFTQHSVLSGTVAYASPEQCQSRPVDHRSDIYSLGVMLYELLTGERPFKGRTPTEIAIHHLQTEPQPPRQLNPEIPLNLEKVLLRALAKSPEDRQQSVQELADQIQANARQVIIPLMPEMSADAESPDAVAENEADRLVVVRRRRRRVAVAAVAMLLVVLAGAMFGRHWLASSVLPVLESALPGAASAQEEAIASDVDSLELAAQLSGDALAGGATKNVPAVSNNSSAQPPVTTSSTVAPVTSGKTNPSDSAKSSGAINTAPTPKTSPANSQPATPAVVVAKPPQTPNPPSHQAESASTRHKTDERKIGQREQDNTASASNETVAREDVLAAKRDRIANNRPRDEEPQRRQPEVRRESQGTVSDYEEPDDAGYDSQQIGPKLIQWSGKVRGEREVTIDLSGAPGTLEIPRVYRNRVAMIEPPSASNRWRFARLRVFGDGGVSFVVRWWPNPSQMSRIAGR
jgi:serine/threonine protein kinase